MNVVRGKQICYIVTGGTQWQVSTTQDNNNMTDITICYISSLKPSTLLPLQLCSETTMAFLSRLYLATSEMSMFTTSEPALSPMHANPVLPSYHRLF